jgi:hypothetical protein
VIEKEASMSASDLSRAVETETETNRVRLRVGAACAVVGPVLAIIVNIFHPRPPASQVGKHEAFLHMAAMSSAWTTIHVGLVVAFILFFGGMLALSHSLAATRGASVARLALAAGAVGTAVSLVQTGVDLALGTIAKDWHGASGAAQATSLQVGGAVEDIDFQLLSIELVTFFGVTFILYGIAVGMSERHPRLLMWPAVLGGLGGVGVGLAQSFVEHASLLTLIGLPIVAAVLSLWMLAMGVLLWARSGRPLPP